MLLIKGLGVDEDPQMPEHLQPQESPVSRTICVSETTKNYHAVTMPNFGNQLEVW